MLFKARGLFSRPQLAISLCGLRSTAKAPAFTVLVMVLPAAMKASSSTLTGATKLVLLPTKTLLPILVR